MLLSFLKTIPDISGGLVKIVGIIRYEFLDFALQSSDEIFSVETIFNFNKFAIFIVRKNDLDMFFQVKFAGN